MARLPISAIEIIDLGSPSYIGKGFITWWAAGRKYGEWCWVGRHYG